MTDETFKNAIFGLFVILLILIGIYFFNNKTSNNEDLANTTQAEETQETARSRIRKKVVKKESKENSENEQLKRIVNDGLYNMTNNGVVSCYGDFGNDVNSLFCKLDYKNGISYAKVKIMNYEEELYTIYRNGTFAHVKKPENGSMSYRSMTGCEENFAKSEVKETFMTLAFEDSIIISRYSYALEDDNYDIDGKKCYKINCLLADTIDKTLFITKDENLIIEMINYEDGDYVDYKYNYDTNEIEIPSEIEEFLNKE